MHAPLDFRRYGSTSGRLVIYFHGAPGAPEEGSLFDLCGQEYDLEFICLDRFAIDTSLGAEAYYRCLANEVLTLAQGKAVALVGFSIGAFIALQTCRYLGDSVRVLHLVSAAAPLEAGDFIGEMAGGRVFQLARQRPGLFVLLSRWQRLLAWLAPAGLFRLLFASAAGGDQALVAEPEFKARITRVLKRCFVENVRGYERDIHAYVQPWQDRLAANSIATHIWHGAEDNWSPPAMADYLKTALPNCAGFTLLERQSHYSALHEAAPWICKLLNEAF